MLLIEIKQDLLQDPSANAFLDVRKVQDRSSGFSTQGSLLQVSHCQFVQEVHLAFKQLEELEVCFWLGDNDCRGALTKEVLALLRETLMAKSQVPHEMCRMYIRRP